MRYFVLKPFEIPPGWMKPRVVKLSPENALGVVLAKDVVSRTDIPGYTFARRDGWAVRSADAPRMRQPVSWQVENGILPPLLKKGEAVWINTGGALPEGADAVIASVNTLDVMVCRAPARPGDNVQQRGSDWSKGERILCAGQRIGARELALLLEADTSEIEGYAKPVVGIIATGTEIAVPTNRRGDCQKRTSNAVYVTALMERIGVDTIYTRTVRDDCDAIARCLNELADRCDVLITIGGTGRGSCDFTRKAIKMAGGVLTECEAADMKSPPFVMGKVRNAALIGLPGNPLGTVMIVQRVLLKMLREAFFLPEMPQQVCRAVASCSVEDGITGELCVSLFEADGVWQAEPVEKATGRSRIFETAHGIIKLGGTGFGIGDMTEVELFAN